ncbi:MAG: HD domain-containing protein [Deltaproteobacteria bacterium]|nr:HD domain-containing protein [Deltaproteobacteria bacterium]
MSIPFNSIKDFLLELDSLKAIKRKTYINGGERLENSAEHSWHLAISCWLFSKHLDRDYDLEKLIKFALIHDLGEIDAGDTFLYDTNRKSAATLEGVCVERLSNTDGNTIED